MDQIGQMHEVPETAQHPEGQRYQYFPAVLAICFLFAHFDPQLVLCGLVILYLLSAFVTGFSEFFSRIAVASGILQHPAIAVEQGSSEPLTMVPCQPSAPQGQTSDTSKVPERAASPREQLVTFRRSVSVVSKAQSHLNAATLSPHSKVEPATTEGPTDDHASLDETTFQIDPENIEEPTSGQPSTGAEDKGPLQTVPLNIDTTIGIQISTDAVDQSSHLDGEMVAQLVSCHISDDGNDSRALEHSLDTSLPIMRNRATTRKSKVQRVVRSRVAKLRVQPPKRSPVNKTLTSLRKGKENEARKLAHGYSAEAGGRMVGLDFGERAEEEAEAGDLIVGLGFQGPVTEVLEGGEPMDVSGDDSAVDIDEVMIGSDVEAEMEVDDETPDSDGDSGFVDADPMQLEEDGPQSAANGASKPIPFAAGALAQSTQQQAAPVPVSGNAVGAFAQTSQQQAAPVSVPVTGNAVASVLQGVAQTLISTNSAADLREARLGKRAEARVVPAQVAGPPPSSEVPVTKTGPMVPPASTTPATSSPEEGTTAEGDTSDTTQPTTTPSSTLPSSTSSTAPASPLPRDSATADDGSPEPSSGKTEPTASETQSRKRGCEKSDGESGKAKADQRDAPANGPKVGKAKSDQELQAPAASKLSQPRTASPPPESSKRLQRQRPNDAEADQEIIPLNDIADQAPTAEEIQQQQLQAVFDSFDEAAFPEPDLDWSSDEDQPAAGKGKGKGKAKE